MTHPCQNELEWSAFCYAAGEMTADQAAAFELRLAEEQNAREALARAVELTQAVVSAESLAPQVVTRSHSAVWSRRLTWMAIGSAASLLVALWWSGGIGSLSTGLVDSGPSPDEGQLAQVWSQTREALAESSDSELWFPAHLSGNAEFPEPAFELADEAAETPAWMTAAVEYAERPDSGDPGSGDRDPFDAERLEN